MRDDLSDLRFDLMGKRDEGSSYMSLSMSLFRHILNGVAFFKLGFEIFIYRHIHKYSSTFLHKPIYQSTARLPAHFNLA